MSAFDRIFSYQRVNVLLMIASEVGMGFALYLQYHDQLDPCPLCIFQRLGLIGLFLIAQLAVLVNPVRLVWRRFYAFLMLMSLLWSAAVASRHVWLQHLPPEDVPACGPGLDYWMDTFPLKDVIGKVLHGSGECAKVDWTWLGASLPHWALVFFSALVLVVLWQFFRKDGALPSR